MSLVNDMLRDLDARRRDAPTRGIGAEKLVPVAERTKKKKSAGAGTGVVVALVIALVFVGVLASYLLLSGSRPLDRSVQSQPQSVSPSAVSSLEPSAGQAANQAAAQQETINVPDAANEALLQLEARLLQLEAQNQSLLQAQQRNQELAQAQTQTQSQAWNQNQLNTAPAQAQINQSAPAQAPASQVAAGNSNFAQDIASAPVAPVASLPANSASSSTTISPRQLSFQDRDRQQVQTALQLWASGQQLAALQTLDAFAHENTAAHHSRETLAKLLIQQGESERALQVVELGLALSPNNNAYRKIKSRLLVENGRAADAVALLSDFAPSVSADLEYHDLLATSYLANRQYDQSILTYRSMLQQNSAEGRWWYGLAAALDAQGISQDAATAYERALQQANLSPGLRQTSQQRLQLLRQSAAAR